MATTINDLYDGFVSAHGSETPERSRDDLHNLWSLADLRYDDLDDPALAAAWWALVFSGDGAFSRGEDVSDVAWDAFDAAVASAWADAELAHAG